jgi:cytoskeleton protein RodZ
MGSLGADLKSERENRKITLAQIAADTRISLHHLQSLEDGRYNDLPGGIYNRVFLRAYCDYIGLDHKAILQRYETEIVPPSERFSRPKASPSQQNTAIRPTPILIWSLMLLLSAAVLLFGRKWIAAVFSPYFTKTPPISFQKKPAAKPTLTTSAANTMATSTNLNQAASLNAASNQQRTSQSVSIKVELTASESCWISINSDSNQSFSRLLEPGETQSFDAIEHIFLILGNAGGVQLKINGKAAKSLGKSGEVVRLLINKQNIKTFLENPTG